jgi:hypothetical protein
MSLSVITTKNSSPLSWLIRYTTKEEASHFAIVFDNRLVFHSNLYGAHPIFKSKLTKSSQIVEELEIKTTLEKEEEVFQLIENKFDGKEYDYLSLIFWFIQAIPYLLANKPLHKIPKNLWNSEDQYVCTEVAYALTPIFPNLKDTDLSTLTPQSILKLLKSLNP